MTTAGQRLHLDPFGLMTPRAMRAIERFFTEDPARRRDRLAAAAQETEEALDRILRLLASWSPRLKAFAIARRLGLHSGVVERALDLGVLRGCLIREQIAGAKQPYFLYRLSTGTRRYLTEQTTPRSAARVEFQIASTAIDS